MNGIQLKLASHAKIHILSTNETPPKSQHPWSAKQMCDQIIRDAYDRYLTQKQDKRSRSVLVRQTRNFLVPNPELPDLPGRTGLKNNKTSFHHLLSH